MIFKKILIRTKKKNELVDITPQIKEIISNNEISNGIVKIFIPHTTAAVTINENADPDVTRDIILGLNKISPELREFKHIEGNSDAHIKSTICGVTEDLLLENGRLILGTWQAVYFCEFDGPRDRKAIITISGE